MRDATHLEAYGLNVKLDDRNARLQIDTGASGLLISRVVAEHAGLKRFSNFQTGGVGDQGETGAYLAYADSVKIGSLEFHDCEVEVSDKTNCSIMPPLHCPCGALQVALGRRLRGASEDRIAQEAKCP